MRNNPEQRRKDYSDALSFWLRSADPRLNRVLFLENSGEDLSFFQRCAAAENIYKKELEFISTSSGEIPAGLHYGWSELKMLDEGLAKSRLLRTVSHLIKATGRLTFPSISNLLDHMPAECDAMVECRIPTREFRYGLTFIPAILRRKNAYASTQLFILSIHFYTQHLFGLYEKMKPHGQPYMIESLIYEKLVEVGTASKICLRFPVNCDPSGVGAKRGQNYDTLGKRLTSSVRCAFRGTGIWF